MEGITSNVFGTDESPEADVLFEDLEAPTEPEASEEVAQPESTTEAEPETPQEPAPEAEAEQEQEAEAPSDEEAPEQDQPETELILGKFKSPDDLAKAYENLQSLMTRQARENSVTRQEYERLKTNLQEVAPLLKQMQEQRDQPQEFDPLDQNQLQAFIQQQIEQGVAQKLAPIEQQREAQEAAQRQAIGAEFASKHPDVIPGSPIYHQTNAVIQKHALDPDTGQVDPNLFPLTVDNLEIAYELATNPALDQMVDRLNLDPTDRPTLDVARECVDNPVLAKVVLANPHLAESDEGMEWAREQAAVPVATRQAQTNASEAQKQAQEQARKRAHVETGGTGAPTTGAPGEIPADVRDLLGLDEIQDTQSVFYRH